MRKAWMGALALAAALAAGSASAAGYTVQMKNQGAGGGFMVFEPAFLAVQPGDTVTFQPTDPGHNAVSIDGMTPAGAQPFAGKLNEALTVSFTTPGAYGYQCTPHYAFGMVGLVVVGPRPPANLAAAQAVEHPAKAQAVFDDLFKQAAQPASATPSS